MQPKTQIQIQELYDEAERLYKVAYDEAENKKLVLDPRNWLDNQNKMRESWELYKTNNHNVVCDSFSRYMNYMYDKYPPGFGATIIDYQTKGLPIDGTLIYNILSNSNTLLAKFIRFIGPPVKPGTVPTKEFIFKSHWFYKQAETKYNEFKIDEIHQASHLKNHAVTMAKFNYGLNKEHFKVGYKNFLNTHKYKWEDI